VIGSSDRSDLPVMTMSDAASTTNASPAEDATVVAIFAVGRVARRSFTAALSQNRT
jgi:hypothetical protein